VVEIGIDESALKALDAIAIAIVVYGAPYLVPVTEPDDPDPISAAEIARVVGHDPVLAEWLDGRRRVEVSSLRALSEMIAALPARENVSAETRSTIAAAVMTRHAGADERVRTGVRDALSCDMGIFRKAYGTVPANACNTATTSRPWASMPTICNRVQAKPGG
jgi:hypothetical protein